MLKPIKFGKYVLLERIAVGGMAEVFVAKAFGVEGFERLLAIKKILPTMGEDAEFITMFVDEARIAVQLAHANIVKVLELGKHDEHLYIAMEYIAGRDLRQVIERFRKRGQQVPIPQACLMVAEVCEALDYAHRKKDAQGRALNIVHRDVSPQNVLVSYDGEVKLIDFGIAKAESRLQKTQAGILKGKFSYMSPEQVKGLSIDHRSDIFACGILLWELVCGEKLFTGDSDFAVLEKVRNGTVPTPRSLGKNCPEGLERVILKALAADPDQRYLHASELHDDLMRFTLLGDMVYGARQLSEWLRDEFRAEWEKEQLRQRGWVAVERVDITPSGPVPLAAIGGPSLMVTDREFVPPPAVVAAAALAEKFTIEPDQDTLALPPTPPHGSNPSLPPVEAKKRPPPDELPTMKMDESALILAEKEFAARRAAGVPLSQAFAAEERTDVDPPPSYALTPTNPVAVPPPPPLDEEAPVDPMRTTDSARVVVDDAAPFDNSDERTGARRMFRSQPMQNAQRKVSASKPRRTMALIAGGLAALVLGGVWLVFSEGEDARPGKLVITPIPPTTTAELFIDGKPAGQLPPFVHTVAPGERHIEVRAEGRKPFTADVEVPSGGRPVEVEAKLELDASAVPPPVETPAPVVQQPPPPAHPAAEAKADLDPAHKKHWWQRKPAPRKEPAAAPAVAVATPVAMPAPAAEPALPDARLRIESEPSGAEVRIDGKLVGRTPLTSPPLDPLVNHAVLASLDGYGPVRRDAKLNPGVNDLNLELQKSAADPAQGAMGYLTCATKPAARLIIDGRDTERWTPVPPANPIALPAGSHTIVFQTADGRKVEEQLNIEAGKIARVIRELQ